jgi:hypothetical protein
MTNEATDPDKKLTGIAAARAILNAADTQLPKLPMTEPQTKGGTARAIGRAYTHLWLNEERHWCWRVVAANGHVAASGAVHSDSMSANATALEMANRDYDTHISITSSEARYDHEIEVAIRPEWVKGHLALINRERALAGVPLMSEKEERFRAQGLANVGIETSDAVRLPGPSLRRIVDHNKQLLAEVEQVTSLMQRYKGALEKIVELQPTYDAEDARRFADLALKALDTTGT